MRQISCSSGKLLWFIVFFVFWLCQETVGITFSEIKRSAEQGNSEAQRKLGDLYCEGIHVIQNFIQAARWYHKAAQQGDHKAEYLLGCMFRGHGIPKNLPEAVSWITKAAEAGYTDAQSSLGFMYISGEGVEKNDATAREWFLKAANQGSLDAMYNLGFLYANTGKGLEAAEAFAWLSLVFERGSGPLKQKAAKTLRRVGSKMSQEDIAKGERLYRTLSPKIPQP